MEQKIFLPSAEQTARMIEDSWQECKKEIAKGGLALNNPDLEAFAKDMFAAGYCYGHNDSLGVIRGQLDAMTLSGSIFSNQESDDDTTEEEEEDSHAEEEE